MVIDINFLNNMTLYLIPPPIIVSIKIDNYRRFTLELCQNQQEYLHKKYRH